MLQPLNRHSTTTPARLGHGHISVTARALCLALALSAAASPVTAQTIEAYPSAGASATGTTNRDYLEADDERGQVYSTLQAGIGARLQDDTSAWFGEYRLIYNQPLATFGSNTDSSGEVETNQTARVGGEFLLTDRLSWTAEFEGFHGRNVVRIVQPFTIADPTDDLVNRTTQQLVTERNTFLTLGVGTGLKYKLTEVDALTARTFAQWRRDFEADVNVVGEGEDPVPQPQRDSLNYGAILGYERQFTPTLTGKLELGYTRYLVELQPDSTGYSATLGARKALTDRLNLTGSVGAIALFPDRDDPSFPIAGDDARRRTLILRGGAAIEALFQNWQASVGYERDATTNGPFGNTLLVDAARIDAYWFWNDDILMRGNIVGFVTRPAFSVPGDGQINETTQAIGAGASAVFRIVDWLALDIGYSFYRRFPLASGEADDATAGNLAARGDITVHTVLIGLSARTTLTPLGPQGPAAAEPR